MGAGSYADVGAACTGNGDNDEISTKVNWSWN